MVCKNDYIVVILFYGFFCCFFLCLLWSLCSAPIGSAIDGNWRTNINITRCVFAHNRVSTAADDKGGVIRVHSAVMHVTYSLFAFNEAPLFGAIYNLLSNLHIIGSSFWGKSIYICHP